LTKLWRRLGLDETDQSKPADSDGPSRAEVIEKAERIRAAHQAQAGDDR
jgi:hypothetical protein